MEVRGGKCPFSKKHGYISKDSETTGITVLTVRAGTIPKGASLTCLSLAQSLMLGLVGEQNTLFW